MTYSTFTWKTGVLFVECYSFSPYLIRPVINDGLYVLTHLTIFSSLCATSAVFLGSNGRNWAVWTNRDNCFSQWLTVLKYHTLVPHQSNRCKCNWNCTDASRCSVWTDQTHNYLLYLSNNLLCPLTQPKGLLWDPSLEMHLTPKKGRTGLWLHGNTSDNARFIAQTNAGSVTLTTFSYIMP